MSATGRSQFRITRDSPSRASTEEARKARGSHKQFVACCGHTYEYDPEVKETRFCGVCRKSLNFDLICSFKSLCNKCITWAGCEGLEEPLSNPCARYTCLIGLTVATGGFLAIFYLLFVQFPKDNP